MHTPRCVFGMLILCSAAFAACSSGVEAKADTERLADRVSGAAIRSLPRLDSRSAPFSAVLHESSAESRELLRELSRHKDSHYMIRGAGTAASAWPFAAAILFENQGSYYPYCGGSLIKDRWILTAAHCRPSEDDLVVLGRHDLLSRGGIVAKIDRVITHPSFNSATGDNDLALIRIEAPGAPALEKASLTAPPAAREPVTAIGWGEISEDGSFSANLLQVTVPVWEQADCATSYAAVSRTITNNMVCAGEEGRDSCEGDSGGPLMAGDSGLMQVGIVSYGEGCGQRGFPGIYTRVDQYLDWIRSKTTER